MANNGLTAEHISTNLNNYEAARTGFFALQLDPRINNIIKATFKGEEAQATQDDRYAKAQEYLKLNVVKCNVPHFSVQPLEYRRGNDVVKFAGVPSFDEGSLTVDDVVGLDTKGILMAWQAKTYNVHTRKGGRMADYKFDCILIEYTQDYEPIREWKLFGCWPSSLSEQPFDRENDDRRQIEATIQYDRAVPLEIGKL